MVVEMTEKDALPKLVEALRRQLQADEDGIMVTVSRQACDEAAAFIEAALGQAAEKREDDAAQPWLTRSDDNPLPYTPAEQRVVDYILAGSNIGGGNDPIGFLLASYAYRRAQGEPHG